MDSFFQGIAKIWTLDFAQIALHYNDLSFHSIYQKVIVFKTVHHAICHICPISKLLQHQKTVILANTGCDFYSTS